METYRAFKSSNFTKVRRTFLGLLNIILAMGSSMDPATTFNALQRAQKSDVFYQRAMNLSGKPSTRGASLEIVQYLLLASQYLQGTQKSSQTWNLHGLAVKGAFALGLHSNQASQRFSPLEIEVRKRTWFGVVLLDRVLSMTFGRPPNIPEDYVRLPLCQSWPSMKGFANAEHQKSSMDFFNASITLHRCIGVTIARLYGQNLGYDAVLPEAELIPGVFELEQELGRWQSSLPAGLQIVSSSTLSSSYQGNVEDRFRTMLTLRYHNLNILVHRPLLCKSLDLLADTILALSPSSVRRMTKDSNDACVASAEETINVVHGILTDHSLGAAVLGAWWFTLYYLFNASLVVFANSLIQRSDLQQVPGGATPISQDIEHLTRAIDVSTHEKTASSRLKADLPLQAFRLLDRDNRIVDRCTEYVEYLLKVVERWAQHGIENFGDTSDQNVSGLGHQLVGGVTLGPGFDEFGANGNLPDLHDFLKDDLELAQFFASGIFDMQAESAI